MTMSDMNIDTILELIHSLVHEDTRPWAQKRAHLLHQSGPEDITALEEFATWFEPQESSK